MKLNRLLRWKGNSKNITILDFPNYRQTHEYDCGVKAMQSVLAYYGIDVNGEEIIKVCGVSSHNGTPLVGFQAVAKKYDLKFKKEKMAIDDLKHYIDKGVPVIVMLQAWPKHKVKDWTKSWRHGHFVVAIGYDSKKIYFEDPYSSLRTYLLNRDLLNRWHDVDSTEKKKYHNLGIVMSGHRRHYYSDKYIKMG